MPKLISVESDGHCCHRPSSNWETISILLFVLINQLINQSSLRLLITPLTRMQGVYKSWNINII